MDYWTIGLIRLLDSNGKQKLLNRPATGAFTLSLKKNLFANLLIKFRYYFFKFSLHREVLKFW